MKSLRTKATEISSKTKNIVHERDRGCCIFCGVPVGVEMASAHVIPRSAGGIGDERNIITACFNCHHNLDQTTDRKDMLVIAKIYLMKTYPHWDEKELTFKKGNDNVRNK